MPGRVPTLHAAPNALRSAALSFLLLVAWAPAAHADPPPDDCVGRFPDPARAGASGEATGLLVRVGGEDVVRTPPAQAAQAGVGRDTKETELFQVRVPASGDPLVEARLLRTKVDANVKDKPSAEARSEAWVADLDVLDGLVTARSLYAYADGYTDPRTAVTDSSPSTAQEVVVAGRQVTATEPSTRIDLPPEAAGEGSYVVVYDRVDKSLPAFKNDGVWLADLTVTMVRVWLADVPGIGPVEILVSQAHARSVAPTVPCGELVQGVQGRAYNVRFWPDGWSGPNFLHGWQAIGTTGGTAGQRLLEQDYGAGRLGFTSNIVATDVQGELETAVHSEATASSRLADVCLKLDEADADCFVHAEAVHAETYSYADPKTAWSKGDAFLLDLRVAGTDVCAALGLEDPCRPKPNTKLTIGDVKLTLNEQQPDWPLSGYSGYTTRAIRLEAPSVGTVIIGYAFTSAEYFDP